MNRFKILFNILIIEKKGNTYTLLPRAIKSAEINLLINIKLFNIIKGNKIIWVIFSIVQ